MSCRHDLALGNCSICYDGPTQPTFFGPNLDGPGAKPMMTSDEYQKLALRTEKTPPITISRHLRGDDNSIDAIVLDRLIHALLGIGSEAGELQDMVKKHLIYKKEFDPINVIEEIGDLFWYCALALDACGYRIGDAMERNIAKLKARYGDKFSAEAALNRDLDKERQVLENK